MIIFLVGVMFGVFAETGVILTNQYSECKKVKSEEVCKKEHPDFKNILK